MSQNAAEPTQAVDLTQERAPEEFRRAIVKDPFASTYRFDYDAARGGPLDLSRVLPGDSVVPRSGYYFDLDGEVIDWYREGNRFPYLAPAAGEGGRFLLVTDRRDATTSDLRWIVLRMGWEGDVREIHIR
jgi:hypothetical protein